MNLDKLSRVELDRLIEIVREHARLARQYPDASGEEKQRIRERIQELRAERTGILNGHGGS